MSAKRPLLDKKAFEAFADLLHFNDQGLIPAVIQDSKSKQVLTLCYFNREALQKSLEESQVYVFRRSQGRIMLKGETSGHTQFIRKVMLDCEGKSLVMQVNQRVAACHSGFFTCYARRLNKAGAVVIEGKRVFDPDAVYRKK